MSHLPNRESIDRPLAALRGAGTVFGVLFYKGVDVVFNDTPFSGERVIDLAQTLDDIAFYFTNEGRDIDQMSFGFDGGNMLIVTDQDYRLVAMHSLNDEVDFIAKACRAFLIDYQMGIFASELNEKGAKLAEQIASGTEPKEDFPEEEEQAVINVAPISSAESAAEERAMTGPIQPIVVPAAPSQVPEFNQSASPDPVPPEKPEIRPIIEPDKNAQGSSRPTDEDLEKMAEAKSRAILSTKQPESTLPPQRKPKIRR